MALTPQHILRERILVALAAQDGGSAQRADVLAAMDAAFGAHWTPQDLQAPASRAWESKWRNRASFERADMVRDGLLVDQVAGLWTLTDAGRDAAQALVAHAATARNAELSRRESMWKALLTAGGPANIAAGLLNDLRVFRGGRGIYADGESTRGAGGVEGITVSFLHNGSSYADELSSGGVRYHYPKTAVPGRDAAEVLASKAAYRLGLPIFVVTTGMSESTRTVHRGYIEEYDDTLALFLVTFTEGRLPPPPPSVGVPFALTSDDGVEGSWAKRRSRPNQQRFAFQVMRRYGATCAACGLAIQTLLHAAHLRSKKELGSDDPRNGLPLCANHHIAFDGGLWGIDPLSTRFVARSSGPSLTDLGITKTDLKHLPELPHVDALFHAWKPWAPPAVPVPVTPSLEG